MYCVMSASVERGLRECVCDFGRNLIMELGRREALSVSVEEALGLIDWSGVRALSKRSVASTLREAGKKGVGGGGGVGKKGSDKKLKKPSCVLPFCGVVLSDRCMGVRFNHGLHTQCMKGREGGRYCKVCMKQAENNASGVPTYGDIEDRAKYGVDYRDPKGKQTIPYANVAEKLGIKMSAAMDAAREMGWNIPEEQLVKRVTKRGRPAKSAAVSDTDSEVSEADKVPKKRGRPAKAKKNKKVSQDDQIALLVAEAYAETTGESKIPVEVKKVAKAKKAAEKKPNKTDMKKQELQKEASEMGLEISDEKLKSLKIGEIRKKMKDHKKSMKEAKAEEAVVEEELVEEAKAEEVKIEKVEEELVEEEVVEEEVEDDEEEDEEGVELSETITVDGVEYYVHEQDGQKIVLSMEGEPVGVYDEETDTIQEAEFE